MAVNNTSVPIDPNRNVDNDWIVNSSSPDLSGCESLKAAESGKSHYIKQIYVTCGSDISVTIGEGETSSAVTTKILDPITFKAAGTNFAHFDFRDTPVKLTANTALTADASGAGGTQIVVCGYTK